MTRTRFYAGFSAGLLSAVALTATLLISATTANTQASTQGISIIEGDANSALALQEMEVLVASAQQATANAAAAGEEISDWDLPVAMFVSLIHVGESVKYGPVISDINGDGLPDFIFSLSGRRYVPSLSKYLGTWTQYVRLNTGSGWEQIFTCNSDGLVWTGDCTYRNL